MGEWDIINHSHLSSCMSRTAVQSFNGDDFASSHVYIYIFHCPRSDNLGIWRQIPLGVPLVVISGASAARQNKASIGLLDYLVCLVCLVCCRQFRLGRLGRGCLNTRLTNALLPNPHTNQFFTFVKREKSDARQVLHLCGMHLSVSIRTERLKQWYFNFDTSSSTPVLLAFEFEP